MLGSTHHREYEIEILGTSFSCLTMNHETQWERRNNMLGEFLLNYDCKIKIQDWTKDPTIKLDLTSTEEAMKKLLENQEVGHIQSLLR